MVGSIARGRLDSKIYLDLDLRKGKVLYEKSNPHVDIRNHLTSIRAAMQRCC